MYIDRLRSFIFQNNKQMINIADGKMLHVYTKMARNIQCVAVES